MVDPALPLTLTIGTRAVGMVLLIIGGILALWFGYRLFTSGTTASPQTRMIVQFAKLKISAHSVGPVVMATAVLWAWLGYQISPTLKTSNAGSEVAYKQSPSHSAAPGRNIGIEGGSYVLAMEAASHLPTKDAEAFQVAIDRGFER